MPILIQAPGYFEHANRLPAGLFRDDPRQVQPADKVVIDLRYCSFVRPPAALWCAVYAHLVIRMKRECEVLVPEDIGVARYLKAIGLFDLLKESGVAVDDRDVFPGQREQIAVRLQRFDSETAVERMANDGLENLTRNGLGAPNVKPQVVETFAELANNAEIGRAHV